MLMQTKTVVHRLALTKARINLGQVVRRVHNNGEYFILEKDGIPVVGIMHADEFEDYLELQDPRLKKQIEEGHKEYRDGKARPLDDLLNELRAKPMKRKKAISERT
jgi:antitoxin (DNA-binding transcriptional repressor) of toxin-antitoxin stability system